MATVADFDSFREQHASFAVLVYAPWCGHSKALLPEVEKAAAQMTKVPFFKVDGTEADALATKLDVKGYPTLLFVRRGDGKPIIYDGLRQARPIADWARAKSEPKVATLTTQAAVESFAKGKSIALVLFAAPASAEAEALAAVAASAGEGMPCAMSDADPTGMSELSSLGALSRPVLVAFASHEDGAAALSPTPTVPLTHASMLAFGLAHRLPYVSAYASGAVEEALFEARVPLHVLYFHSAAVDTGAHAALRAAGKSLRGRASVATINVADSEEVASYFDMSPHGSLPTPSLLAFSLTHGTKYVHAPSDGALTAEGVVAFATAAAAGDIAPHVRSQPELPASSGNLVELVGSTFAKVAHDAAKDVLVQFYSPTCGHCRKLQPVYAQVASHFAAEDDVVVAQLDAVANDVVGLEPAGFPTIILYTKANKRGIEYDGSRDAHDLIQFVTDARAGRNHIGGLPPHEDDGTPDEDDGYRVEL